MPGWMGSDPWCSEVLTIKTLPHCPGLRVRVLLWGLWEARRLSSPQLQAPWPMSSLRPEFLRRIQREYERDRKKGVG